MNALPKPYGDINLQTLLDAADTIQLRKFTRDEFYAMDRAGIFDEDSRVELIDGRIIKDMAPIGGPHGWSVERLTRSLVRCTDNTEYSVRVQSGASMPGERELQPDFAIYKPNPNNVKVNPAADQIILVVEVSESSLAKVRTDKMQLYAAANIPTYWVVDVARNRVFVYSQPEDGAYSHLAQHSGDDLLEVCGRPIRVADIF